MLHLISLALLAQVTTGPEIAVNENLLLGQPALLSSLPSTSLLTKKGFVLLHDNERKVPIWVAFRLKAEYVSTNKRAGSFKPDPELPVGQRAELVDYKGFGFDRGHMASSGDMRRTLEIQKESFLLSNMVPQNHPLNSGKWSELEQLMRDYAKQYGNVTIFAGPIFGVKGSKVTTIGPNKVVVPRALYRIIVRKEGTRYKALAFEMLNVTPDPKKPLQSYLVSIDRVEKDTGLDFLTAIPDDEEAIVEAAKPKTIWKLVNAVKKTNPKAKKQGKPKVSTR